ncbi:hypothetical protein SASPL_145186 [Salvia splendens]|uniref:Uncharacterized protein n=1 Tax=Salvia splendens TaxID=180675 RepID=A0A8X8WGN1_SALSN|nr:uncharacterized protein LOC121773858 [Salvia splendens]KAG6394597.1 hypothetical protein SASPL_145186 [Salvia splendens]
MIATEEFTFPVISSNAALNLALLPPLWRISDPDQTSTATAHRRQFASQAVKIDDAEEDAQREEAGSESQEKMDLLWEDFNEGLQSSADSELSEETSENHHSNNSNNKSGGDEFEDLDLEECANVRQLRLIRAKPRKMESLVKVVKKLFARTNQQKTNH